VALASREATELFSLQVHADTVRKVVKRNDTTICRPGHKRYFSEKEIQTLEVAILSHLSLSQASCTKEKKSNDFVALIQALVTKAAQGRKLKDGRAFWRRMQGRLSSYISLDSESLIEMHRQIWTTYGNLTTWFDGWEAFACRATIARHLSLPRGAKYYACHTRDRPKLRSVQVAASKKYTNINGISTECLHTTTTTS
jgi:hypothetical protein